MKRVVTLVVILALVGAGTWVFARHSESPEQVAARAAAPSPVPVIATVRKGYVHPPVSLMATAQESGIASIPPAAALVGVVTRSVAAPGAVIESGNVVLHVNGRPVFVIQGSFPMYRDIVAGDTGDDVRQIQEGLRAAGLLTIPPDGTFGPRTQKAVADLYRRAGLVAPTAPAQEQIDAKAVDGGGAANDGGVQSPAAPPAAQPGSIIPAAEFVVAPHLPARVVSTLGVGATVAADAELMRLGSGDVVLSAAVPTESLGALATGAQGTFIDDAGTSSSGTVTSVTADPQSGQATVQATITGQVTPGKSYVVTVDNPAGIAEQSLLVPATAVVTRHGTAFVYVEHSGAFAEVPVTVTGAQGGTVAVTPATGTSRLTEGAQVRVG